MLENFILKGLLIGLLVSLPIGPMGILVIQRTVNRDFRSGFYTGIGIALTDSLYALIAGFSVSYIISFLRTNQTIIQIVGAIALFCLGLYIFTSHPLKAIKKYRKSNKNPVQCLFSSMLITLSNPIPILAYIIVFTGAKIFFDIDHPTSPILFIISFIIGASSWWFLLTFTINKFRHHFNLLRLWWFNKISGGLIMSIVIISTILMLIYGNPGF